MENIKLGQRASVFCPQCQPLKNTKVVTTNKVTVKKTTVKKVTPKIIASKSVKGSKK